MTPSTPSFFPTKMDITSRDIACLVFAAAVHSLLFLWQGGILNLPQDQGGGLGDMIVNVNFMADVPSYEEAGGGSPKPKGFLSRIASIVKGQGAAKAERAPGVDESQSDTWAKAEKLTDKPFSAQDGFKGIMNKTDSLDIAKGTSKEVIMKPSDGNFEKAQPNLKENTFKMAKMDVPFPILKPKTQDALANVNAIPVVVGKTTSGSIKSLDGGAGAGPALQSKTFASKGSSAGSSFSGLGKTSGGSGSNSGSGGLAMGAGSGGGSGQIAGVGGSGSGAGGVGGSGYGDGGSGGGRGGGNGSGSGSGSGGGRSWGGGGSGFGSGGMQTLPRRSVAADTPAIGTSVSKSHPGFTITGALANRPIASKVLPPYTSDARVALRFRVDWSGKVLDGIIVEISSGNPSFDRQVIAALKQWLFSPLAASRTNEVQEGLVAFVFKGV